jgi:hypothetical protein
MGQEVDYTVVSVKVLHGHTSPETAFVVDDYPASFTLRVKIRYWVETAVKGAKKGQMRMVSQTTNPRKAWEVWNAPKPGQYNQLVWLYVDPRNGHVKWQGADIHINPAHDARLRLMGIYEQMTEEQRKVYNVLVGMSQRYAPPWEEWTALVDAAKAHYAGGVATVYDNGEVRTESGEVLKRYLPEYDYAVLVAAVQGVPS